MSSLSQIRPLCAFQTRHSKAKTLSTNRVEWQHFPLINLDNTLWILLLFSELKWNLYKYKLYFFIVHFDKQVVCNLSQSIMDLNPSQQIPPRGTPVFLFDYCLFPSLSVDLVISHHVVLCCQLVCYSVRSHFCLSSWISLWSSFFWQDVFIPFYQPPTPPPQAPIPDNWIECKGLSSCSAVMLTLTV